MKSTAGWITLLMMMFAGAAPAAEPTSEQLEFFEKKIRPVLVENCYECHSAASVGEKKLRGDLLLDTREGARTGGETGPAVVPGKPDESLLVSALKHESFEMPPKGKLPDAVIADFVKWVEMGAPDPRDGKAVVPVETVDIEGRRDFWSFRPLAAVEPPRVNEPWVQTPVDAFIRQKQQALGLHPNEVADARILVRRAWFDLLGLPPSPAEMTFWTERLAGKPAGSRDTIDRDAWAELIDFLLSSEHYGERWARHWMDVARFAESHGYEQDYDRPHAYHYRDFLIQAFNRDLPYDQFVRWQLAGDELAPEEPLAWMATGFLGGGAFPTQLTEAEFESARYDELDDMVATTGVAFLGLSVGCARCHDHKFDPIPSRDYYRMAASFTTAIRSEKEFDLHPEENARRRKAYEERLGELESELARFERDALPGSFRDFLASYDPAAGNPTDWEVLHGEVASSGGSKYARQSDGSYLAAGDAPAKDVITFTAETDRKQIASFRLEALAHESLPQKGPGRAPNGNFALGEFRVSVQPKGAQAGAAPVKLSAARATHEQNDSSLSVASSIDGDPVSGWAVDGQVGRDHAAVFVVEQPLESEQGARLTVTLAFNHPNTKHSLGRFRLSVSSRTDAEPSVGEPGPDAKVVEALTRLKQDTREESSDWNTALGWWKTTFPEWQERSHALAEHRKTGPQVQLTKVMVTSEGLPHIPHHADGRGFPHFYPEVHLLRRGDVHQKGDVVSPGFLQVLMRGGADEWRWVQEPLADEMRTSFRRASLAGWITDVDHGAGHLAARVIVNRLWQHHFGRGLVPTPSDFGASGEPPSHPELLDWLAADLIAGEWRLKRMHKQIMTSSVYMQSSDFEEARAAVDRENTFHWRRTPRRLEAEAIRDAMLAVSGQLDATMYGPGTLDANMRRRSVYFFIKRSQLIPTMMLFDWPEHLVSIGQRSSTTIAPQALMFMNSPQARGYAEGFAARLPAEDAAAVRQAYLLAYGREPNEMEQSLSLKFLARQRAAHSAAGHADAAERARGDLCQTLMSMNEFVYVD